jgi:hypothetical protein
MKPVRVFALVVAGLFAICSTTMAQSSTKPVQIRPSAAKAEDPAAKLPKPILDAVKKDVKK